MDQRGLVERARAGDHDAFTVLARAALPRLDAAARLILRDRELAQDAVQDALLRAWRDLRGLRDPDRFELGSTASLSTPASTSRAAGGDG